MISGVFVKKESDVNSEAKIIGGHHDDPYILESIAGNKNCKNEIEDKNEKNMQSIKLYSFSQNRFDSLLSSQRPPASVGVNIIIYYKLEN